MPLRDGYGVLRGTIERYFRDPADAYGRYFHGNLVVRAPAGQYACAIDVDSHQSATGVEWRVLTLTAADLGPVAALSDGWTPLAASPASGALDYVRSPALAGRVGCLLAFLRLFRRDAGLAATWRRGASLDALNDLEPLAEATRAAGRRVLVFGEPFTRGLGVHNIHQNQGDPPGSRWAAENGPWQDGCTLFEQADGRWAAFMNKFTSQAYVTDASGRPI